MPAGGFDPRSEIVNLLAAYHYHGDGGRVDDLAALFADAGVLETADSGTYGGREAIAGFLRSRHQTRQAIDPLLTQSHHLASIYISDLSATSASAHSRFQVLTPHGLDHWGSYSDELVLQAAGWRFLRRRVRVEGHSPTSWRNRRQAQDP